MSTGEIEMTDHANELRRLAQAATPGPWINYGRQPNGAGLPHSAVGAKTLIARVYSEAYGDAGQETANASFIAAANPAAISELLDRLEVAERERDALRAENERIDEAMESLLIRCDDSDSAMYGTLSTSFVRDTVRIARAAPEESK